MIRLPDKEDNSTRHASDLVYKEIMNYLLLKRSTQTALHLPNGKVRYPREYIPGL